MSGVTAEYSHFVAMAPYLLSFGLRIVVDHMGLPDPRRGVNDSNFQALLRLLADGKIWIKLTPYRTSQRYPDYEDMAPFHRAFLDANPERLVWGSDWPHVHMKANMPDAGHLVDLCDRWTGAAALRQRIFVDNPAELYGFPP